MNRHHIIRTACLLALIVKPSAESAIVTQTVGNIDWNASMWGTPAAAPSAGNHYVTNSAVGATTRVLAPDTFGGDSLELTSGTQLLGKIASNGTSTITGALTLNGGTIHNGPNGNTSSTYVWTINSASLQVTTAGTLGLSGGGNGLIIGGALIGSGDLYIGNQATGGLDDFVTISSIGAYTGGLYLGQFASGSTLTGSGDLTVDFGSASHAFGNSLTISNAAVLKVNNGQTLTFNQGALLVGSTAIDPGTYTANALGSSFTGTGTIVVIPELSSLSLATLGVLLLLHRRRKE